VERVISRMPHEFVIVTYPRDVRLPLLRAVAFLLWGLAEGIMRHRGCELIHAHYAVPQGLLGVLLKRILKLPLVVTVHGSDVLRLAETKAGKVLVGLALNGADAVVAVSNFLGLRLRELGVPPGKIRVIYGGVELPEKSEAAPGKRVLFVGSLVEQKGVDVLLRSFRRVKEQIPEAELLIVGDGRERERLEELSRSLGLRDVHFEGAKEDLEAYYSGSRVLALPSRTEGFGLVALEAMARGLPVVATRTGGIPEVVLHRRTGILVEPDNPEALAEALIEVLSNGELWKRLSSRAREWASKFSWDRTAAEYEEVYREVLA